MKYVATGTLKDRLGQPLRAREVLDILKQIALALDHAHDQGVLHRDVKPSNILVDAQGWIYLSDFGLAKMVEGSVQLTASGVGVGTPAYMSPEQGQGLPVDARTDVYALGIILYEMLTGRVPYEAETPMAVVVKHITSPLPLPRTLNPDIPGSVERVVLKALAKDPNDRYHRAGELVAALETATRQTEPEVEKAARPSSVSPAPGPSRQAQPAPVSPAAVPRPPAARPAPHPAAQPARESNLPVLAMAGLAGVILVVAIALVVVVLLLLRRGVASDQLAGSGPDAAAVTFVPAAATLAVATLSPVATPGPPSPAPIETAPLQPTQVPVQAPPSSHTSASTDTPSPTHTPVSTDSPSPTFTPVATDTPSPTSTPVATDTPSPTFTPPPYLNPDTGYLPDAVFNSMWAGLGGGSSALGYPTGPAVADRNYSKQYF
jgi:serine/threonine protein kinase